MEIVKDGGHMNHKDKNFFRIFCKTASFTTILFLGCAAWSNISVSVDAKQVNLTQSISTQGGMTFKKLNFGSHLQTKAIGQASLPSKSFLVIGHPSQIQVKLNTEVRSIINDVLIEPTTPENCRCTNIGSWKYDNYKFDAKTYFEPQAMVKKTYMGDYRGTPITKVQVLLAEFSPIEKTLKLFNQVHVSINSEEFRFQAPQIKSYLVIAPAGWESAVADFVAYKANLGFSVRTQFVAAPANTKESIQSLIKQDYEDNRTNYALIIGDETTIPMFELDTAGSYRTPSDLPYFAFGYSGLVGQDHIPDIFSGRIVAKTAANASAQLAKIMAQETSSRLNKNERQGSTSVIGVASNEGFEPSDAEYVTEINANFASALKGTSTFLHQDDENSVPATLNSSFDHGSYWMTYLGHGSGFSWPSMYDSYWTDNIQQMSNQNSFKPVIIDVACQNGRLLENYLGSQLMFAEARPTDSSRGAIAYFGGTVNISWHPPAVMARGISIEHAKENFQHLGEALLAGQMYLTSNWQNDEDVVDNFEWYHLQGDPSYSIGY